MKRYFLSSFLHYSTRDLVRQSNICSWIFTQIFASWKFAVIFDVLPFDFFEFLFRAFDTLVSMTADMRR